ncbi:DUF309 domain-containing protein [Halolamina sp. C58]|uniref:DUF309 domain-containing protein n=1 Tax=Halolamina sp. C58 TaxID=3421640 RepID=UPI003EBB9609
MTDETPATAADALRAGVAAHNVGEYDIARAIWAGETPMAPETDADDSFRTGLAAFATAVLDARRGRWTAALAAAEEADSELADYDPSDHTGVDLTSVERWLAAFRADPELVERSPPPRLSIDGEQPTPGELPLSAAALVAVAVATGIGDDPEVVVDAVRYARESDQPESTRYATFVRDYADADASQRSIVFERLSSMVQRERRKEDDVSGLF